MTCPDFAEATLLRTFETALKPLDQAGVDQQTIEAARLRTILAGVEKAPTSQHDLFLLGKGRIEREARRLLNHERQIRPVDRVHDRGTCDGREIDGVDGVVSEVVARIVALELPADLGFA